MKRRFNALAIAIVLTMVISTGVQGASLYQTPGYTQFQIAINSVAHQTYGLFYPVTYMFHIPSGSSNLSAQYRTSSTGTWNTLAKKSSTDFFNGVNAVRFDYSASTAYVSIAFEQNSDNLYVRILNSQSTEVPVTYLGMPSYYDNRKAAVTITLDDWASYSNTDFDNAATMLSGRKIHFTVGVITGAGPDISLIQKWANSGYMEVASHSRSHPCTDQDYLAHGYNYEIAGSKQDILTYITLTHPYITTYLEPCGFENSGIRQAIVSAGYLDERGFTQPPVQNTFSAWGTDGAYQRAMYTVDTWSLPWYTLDSAILAQANASFDSVYAAGGIYHLVDHPWQGRWYAGLTLDTHTQYIANRLDVWYAAFGELYLYHYVQERGQVTVTPVGSTSTVVAPTATNTALPPTATATSVSPTSTTAAPTATSTSVNPTNTPLPATATSTSLPATATNTPLPATATNTPAAPTPTATSTSAQVSSIWSLTDVPSTVSVSDPNAVELGVKFRSDVSGYVTGLRFYKGSFNTGTHIGHLWSVTGTLLAQVTFSDESASGWQTATLSSPVAITPNTVYVASYHTDTGYFSMSRPYFTSGRTNSPLYAYSSSEVSGGNGLYRYGSSAFPDQTYDSSNYWVDVLFSSNVAPTPTSTPTSIVTNTPVPPTATNTPIPPTPTTIPGTTSSIWSLTDVPATISADDPNAVELGVKFRSDVSGYVTGLRFYKGSFNTGTHIGHLWSVTGTLLAQVTFSDESASGWQTATLSSPVAITPNTVYVASYHTDTGYFSMSRPYFTSGRTNSPLYAYSSSEVSGGNGLYRYGSSAFPNQTYDSSNYWVDVLFTR